MQRLDELQSHFRDAVVYGDDSRIVDALVGGDNPGKRLAVHQRNYQSSLIDALLMKFPATGWLLGTPLLAEAAKHFIRENPPNAPCIAEYGAAFPDFLGQYSRTGDMIYLSDFAKLEWHVGKVAIAVEEPPLDSTALSAIEADAVSNVRLTLQSGVRYQDASWPVDELLTLYLTETAPDQFHLTSAGVWIEVRGNRGDFLLNRLDAAEFMFRKSISEGCSIGDAAECALEVGGSFDPGRALAGLFAEGLVTEFLGGNR